MRRRLSLGTAPCGKPECREVRRTIQRKLKDRLAFALSLALFAWVLASFARPAVAAPGAEPAASDPTLPRNATWTTSSRLLKIGEAIDFQFRLPPGMRAGALIIYPRYLEHGDPGKAFQAGGDLKWLERLPQTTIPLKFTGGQASITYTPKKTGSYLAKWQAGAEARYRYFSVIDDDYIVLSFSTFWGAESEPTFHGLGIPLDYHIPIGQFRPEDPVCRKLLGFNRRYGDLVVAEFPDMPEATHADRVRAYGDGMKQVRELLPDPLDHRALRLVARHDADPGCTRALAEIGINDHCGLQEANCRPWLGMPEFLYYSAPDDCRKVNQGVGGQVVAHQWDFCGSFHFLGPVQWHYAASEGEFARTQECLKQGMDECRNLVADERPPGIHHPLVRRRDGQPGLPEPHLQRGLWRRQDARVCRTLPAADRLRAAEKIQGRLHPIGGHGGLLPGAFPGNASHRIREQDKAPALRCLVDAGLGAQLRSALHAGADSVDHAALDRAQDA